MMALTGGMSRVKGKLSIILAVMLLVITGSLMAVKLAGDREGERVVKGLADESAEMTLINQTEDIPNAAAPSIKSVNANTNTVGLYEKFELHLELDADYDNPYNPDEVDLSMELVSPGGKLWRVNGFFDATGYGWKIRFSPDEVGLWSYRVNVTDRSGLSAGADGSFEAVESGRHGWIVLSEENPRYLEYKDGSSFYGVSIAYPWGILNMNLDKIAAHGGNLITYWNGNYDNTGNGGGKQQLEPVWVGIGRIDPLKAKRIDDLLEAFEERGLLMNFVIWPHDSLTHHLSGWPSTWEHNAYSLLGEAKDFYMDEEMWTYQERLYRYIIARWGHSHALGIWDIICEINGTDGWAFGSHDAANAWVEKVHRFFKEHDPYGHPTKGSMAGNRQDYWDAGYRTLDIADRENYYDLHYTAYAEDIRQRWEAYEKPLFIGETGNITDVQTYHQAIWVSLVNGLAATPFWWEFSLVNDEMFERMKHFASFVQRIDFREKREPVYRSAPEPEEAQVWAMRGDAVSFGWLLAETGGSGGKTVELPEWPDGVYEVDWYDPHTGESPGTATITASGGVLVLNTPESASPDLAFMIRSREGR